MNAALNIEHPAFSVFDGAVRERLRALDHFPSPSEFRALTAGVASSAVPWFDFETEDRERVREAGGFDRFIAETKRIPTREGSTHDLFGGLIWLHFPQLKTALHRVHLAGENGRRGSRENAATHLDESGVLVVSSDTTVFRGLSELNWPSVFCEHRAALLASTRFLCFGHGLLDALREPHSKLMGMALFVRVDEARLTLGSTDLRVLLDRELGARLPRFLDQPARLQPLPVLGIPGWCADQSAEFYEDTQYFRRARLRLRAATSPAFLEIA